ACRVSHGGCDPQEKCDGINGACPIDHLSAAGTICRVTAGGCDKAETCDGVDAGCPPDVSLCPTSTYCSGTSCVPLDPPGNPCGDAGTCASGYCVDGVCCDRPCNGGACDSCAK